MAVVADIVDLLLLLLIRESENERCRAVRFVDTTLFRVAIAPGRQREPGVFPQRRSA